MIQALAFFWVVICLLPITISLTLFIRFRLRFSKKKKQELLKKERQEKIESIDPDVIKSLHELNDEYHSGQVDLVEYITQEKE